MGTSTGSTTSYQQSNTSPWSGQQPYLSDLFSQAKTMYANQAYWPQYYPGSTYVNMTPTQQSVMNDIINYGTSGGSTGLQSANSALTSMLGQGTSATAPAFGQAQDYLSSMIGGSTLNPWSSPGFQSVVGNTLASTIPAITSGYIGGGRSDSGLAARAASEGTTTAIGNLAFQQYNTERQLQQQAAAQAASNYLNQQGNVVNAAGKAPAIDYQTAANLQAATTAAAQQQTDWQNQVNAAINRWNYVSDLPWNMLSQYGNYVSGNYGSSTTSASQQPYYTNSGSSIGSILSGVGGVASALGGSSGLLSLLGLSAI